MNIPEDVHEALLVLCEFARREGALPVWASAEIVEKWLDAQPAAPEPDWSQAPDWARWWAADSDGESTYYAERPEPDEKIACWDSARWSAKGSTILSEWDKTSPLPLGVDWRTTLRKRPEAAE